MAESIIIHFNEQDPAVVLSRIESTFVHGGNQTWCLPENSSLILVYSYNDFETEYEASERDAICTMLGGIPTASLAFEIRRSRPDEACDVLERIVRVEFHGLNFVVDDMERYISASELEGTSDFLDLHRYKNLAEQQRSQQKRSGAESMTAPSS